MHNSWWLSGLFASRWYASVTCSPNDISHLGMTNNGDDLETAYPSSSIPRYYCESDLEFVYVLIPTNAQLASYMSMYHKRQAFVTYLQYSPGGATVFRWTIDRTLINTYSSSNRCSYFLCLEKS